MQPADSLPDLFSGILLDPSISNQMSLTNFDDTDYNLASALTEWENNLALPNLDSSQLTPISSQEISHSPSVAPESSQSRAESAASADGEETVCYGMVSGYCIRLSDLSDLGHDSPALAAQR